MKLTKASVPRTQSPRPAPATRYSSTKTLPGFGLRLRDGGKRTWIAQYRVGARQRRVTIGTVETTDAEAARKRAKSILSKVHLGADPQLEKTEARAQAASDIRQRRRQLPRAATPQSG